MRGHGVKTSTTQASTSMCNPGEPLGCAAHKTEGARFFLLRTAVSTRVQRCGSVYCDATQQLPSWLASGQTPNTWTCTSTITLHPCVLPVLCTYPDTL
jgi:hypothetical protein